MVACVVAPFLEWCGKDALGGAIGLDLIHIEVGWIVRVVWVEFNDCFLVLGRQIAHLGETFQLTRMAQGEGG